MRTGQKLFFSLGDCSPALFTMASLGTATTLKGKKERALTNNERMALMGTMWGMANNGKLPRGTFSSLSKKYPCMAQKVSWLWDSCPQSRKTVIVVMEEVLSRKHRKGKQHLWDRDALMTAVKEVPIMQQQMFCNLVAKIDFPRLTLHHNTKQDRLLKRK